MTALPQLVDNDTHIAVLADASGNIRTWNSGAEALFGHAAEVALAHRVDLVVPHEYRDMHWSGFDRTMGTAWRGYDAWGDIEGLHQNG